MGGSEGLGGPRRRGLVWNASVVIGLLVGLAIVPMVGAAATATPASSTVTTVATISGGGLAVMDPSDAAGAGPSAFGVGATLYSDGTATGHFDCVDLETADHPGNVWGTVTGWFTDAHGLINLNIVGKIINFPDGHPSDIAFTVTIQKFGGAGVGHWTLEGYGIVFCIETLTSGQIILTEA